MLQSMFEQPLSDTPCGIRIRSDIMTTMEKGKNNISVKSEKQTSDTVMTRKKPSRSILRTQQLLKQGLIELMKEKPVQKITVRELVDYVNLNRGTFYLHYRDIYDLLEQIEDDLTCRLREILSANPPEKLNGQPYPMLQDIFQLISDTSEFCRMVLGQNRDPHFIVSLTDIIREKCFADWNYLLDGCSPRDCNSFCAYCVSGCIGMIEYWLFQEPALSVPEIADMTSRYIVHGFGALNANFSVKQKCASYTPAKH